MFALLAVFSMYHSIYSTYLRLDGGGEANFEK